MDPSPFSPDRRGLRPSRCVSRGRLLGTTTAMLLALSLARPAVAGPPSAAEQAVFDAILLRLTAHAGSMPKAVGSAFQTMTPGCWTATVPCPAGAEVTCIEYKVCTSLVAWSAAAAGDGQGAAYLWDATPTITEENGCKVIVMDNEVMVDQAALSVGEAPGRGDIDRTVNETLLYHELLHGQLGIEALDDAEIVNPVCQCAGPNPAARSDAGHQVIPGLQDGYLVAAGVALGANVQIVRIQPVAGTDGGFALDFGPVAPGCVVNVVAPENGNIAAINVADPDTNNHVAVTGRLAQAGQAGRIIVLIDPPLLWQIVYTEIMPGPTPTRSMSWGGVKLIYR